MTGFTSEEWLQRTLLDFLLCDEHQRARLLQLADSGGQLTLNGCRYLSAQHQPRYCNLTSSASAGAWRQRLSAAPAT